MAQFTLTETEFAVLEAIADTFVPPVDPELLRPIASKRFGPVDIDEVAQMCPSKLPGFRGAALAVLGKAPTKAQRQFKIVLNILAHRPTGIVLTGSMTLLTEMSLAQREDVIRGWRDSYLTAPRKLFHSLYDVATASFVRMYPMHYRAMGHPERELLMDDKVRFAEKSFYKYNMLDLGPYATRSEINVDAVIVGSGAGAGVVAEHLTAEGYNVLVLEKGKFYPQSELSFNEDESMNKLFENAGGLQTDDGAMLVLAGSTLGGGTTVNWSASLRTPDNIRQQFGETVPFYKDQIYDQAMDYVMHQMGCSVDHIEHSFSNNLLLEGSRKLGYAARAIDQNTGGSTHHCGFCGNGCRFGEKQGGVVNWLRVATERGAKIIDETQVTRVIHSNGRATGVHAIRNNGSELVVNAKKVVVAGGSLHTPLILQRSKFRNKHIGRGLKLHPVTVVFGEYPDEEINAYEKAIMTSVSTEFDDLDGRGHGPKLETLYHQPLLEAHFLPWNSGAEFRKQIIKYNHLAAMLIITRDRSTGTVTFQKDKPFSPSMNYTTNKYDLWALVQGSVGAANVLYVQGASRIITGLVDVPIFETNKPKEGRDLNDADYREWVSKLQKATYQPPRDPLGSAHQMASCRMGNKGPSYSPLDDKGRLWECKNVFVADASTMPAASGVNPMITTMATARVIAQNISKELAPSSRL
uniref:Long-chain-alcohol oxidase n=1 Tax=Blastobotrys adeninivorans TaxID=409370 RepID=A0A060TH05_BLAAD